MMKFVNGRQWGTSSKYLVCIDLLQGHQNIVSICTQPGGWVIPRC